MSWSPFYGRHFKKSLPEKHDVRIILTGTKSSSQFNSKDYTNKQHKHDLVYFSRCPDCTDSYIRETARRISQRAMDNACRDIKPHIVRHCLNSNHVIVDIENLKILNMGYNNKLIEGEYLRHYLWSWISIALHSMCKKTLSLCRFLIDFNCASIATL